jgi:DNA-directed RNA polymerase specialized sigma24 family protein
MGMSDQEANRLALELLVLRAATGDREALTCLAERFDAPMRYYVRRMLGREDRVADVAQEVWVEVIRQLPRLSNPSSFIPWFYRIALSALHPANESTAQQAGYSDPAMTLQFQGGGEWRGVAGPCRWS